MVKFKQQQICIHLLNPLGFYPSVEEIYVNVNVHYCIDFDDTCTLHL